MEGDGARQKKGEGGPGGSFQHTRARAGMGFLMDATHQQEGAASVEAPWEKGGDAGMENVQGFGSTFHPQD